MEPDRQAVISQLADLICAVECSHPLRVAIDGVDAAGKTMLADELVVPLQTMGRVVIRASVDGFHNPRTVRYQRGADSPEGYYRDSFNHGAILRAVLNPLGPDGNRKIRRTGFDFRADEPTNQLRIEVPEVAILLFDGVFLWHPTLKSYWDFLIFVEVDFNISIARAVARDVQDSPGDLNSQVVQDRYNRRYVPGQQIYFNEAQPKNFADVIFENNDIDHPNLIIK